MNTVQELEAAEVVTDIEGLPRAPFKLFSGTRMRVYRIEEYNIIYATPAGMAVIASYDTETHGRLLHLSASYAHRVPYWSEIRDIQRGFAPKLPMMMVLPRMENHINNHEYTLNWFQIPEGWLEAVAQVEGPAVAEGQLRDLIIQTNGGVVLLSHKHGQPDYGMLTDFRTRFFAADRDVMLWWDAPGVVRPNIGLIRMAFTPEPWKAGDAVGIPGLTHDQSRLFIRDQAFRTGSAGVSKKGKR